MSWLSVAVEPEIRVIIMMMMMIVILIVIITVIIAVTIIVNHDIHDDNDNKVVIVRHEVLGRLLRSHGTSVCRHAAAVTPLGMPHIHI